ncbi:MAG: butyrate kinase [Eubacterium sp.]|nr:butyrate kinase [Eubacterium sp.]
MNKILVINTGSTSTKAAVFHDDRKVLQANLIMPEDILKSCEKTVDQLPFRTQALASWLKENKRSAEEMDIIAARGGPLPPVHGGAYKVNRLMIDVLTYAPVSRHESALSCMIGVDLAEKAGVPVIIYDSVSVDEMNAVAKYTGIPSVKNRSGGHILNTRKVGKLVAEKTGAVYGDSTYVIAHLGGSISVTAHDRGKIVDCVTAFNGPMSTQRAGRIPTDYMIRLCYSGKYTKQELLKLLNGGSGYKGYFGTQDAKAVSRLLEDGDRLAGEVTEALAYQTCKGIAEMAIACENPVDRIIITGGMANFKYVTDYIVKRISFLAPVEILPGEFEMEALAEGARNVLLGKESAKEYDVLPAGYSSEKDFYEFIRGCG